MVWRLIHDEIKVIALNKIDGATSINTDLYTIYESMTINECIDKVNELGLIYVDNEPIISLVNIEVDEIKLTIDKNELIKTHYDNIVSLVLERISSNDVNLKYLETQTILAEDNNIDLNYSGTQESSIGGGIRVLHALGNDNASELITDSEGNFTTNTDFKAKALTIPTYTPNSSEDINGTIGNITIDEDYLYIKGIDGWKRIGLDRF